MKPSDSAPPPWRGNAESAPRVNDLFDIICPSNVSSNLNEFKVYKYKIFYIIITLLDVVVIITGNSQSYHAYIKNHPVVKVKDIRRTYEEVKLGDLKHHVFVYQLYKDNKTYRAFCAGSIITDARVLTSAHCFLTNKKRERRKINKVKVVAGILYTIAYESNSDEVQQWRSVWNIYTQRFFRHPAFNLAVLEVEVPWTFNNYVNKIPYTEWDQDFDGVCSGTAVKIMQSWSLNKSLVVKDMMLVNKANCEYKLKRSCINFYCTKHEKSHVMSLETEGGGLVCHGTGDPAETEAGVLVGVTSLVSSKLLTLHNRIGLFHDWVADACPRVTPESYFLLAVIVHIL
ncbi:chymotrypsinogen B-like [Epargyreus clarus]|uniref:chymotrypsinogen B-like n=1 Tax=Epargyreus clarus TaxID=520877 RepID=UPI003C2FB23D